MAKISFKPTWDGRDAQDIEKFQAEYTGKETPSSVDEYVKWLYNGKQ